MPPYGEAILVSGEDIYDSCSYACPGSITDRQADQQIVTLDYPTGQNSVAIITGLGELFLQGYNHYGECAVGETTAFYDHFVQITNINCSNNYQCLDVFCGRWSHLLTQVNCWLFHFKHSQKWLCFFFAFFFAMLYTCHI